MMGKLLHNLPLTTLLLFMLIMLTENENSNRYFEIFKEKVFLLISLKVPDSFTARLMGLQFPKI